MIKHNCPMCVKESKPLTKLCPKCGKPLERYHNPSTDVHFWGHPHSFTAYGARELCDYSEPESAPRCPKRKERAK